MFKVQGYCEGVPYYVTVDNGEVTGSPRIGALLDLHEGEQFRIHPVGESVPLTAERDDLAVLSALRTLTDVRRLAGDAPVRIDDPADDEHPDNIY